MYEKNLSEDLRLRLSKDDMDFLRDLSSKRSMTVSGCIRSIIGEYRRSLDTLDLLTKAVLESSKSMSKLFSSRLSANLFLSANVNSV